MGKHGGARFCSNDANAIACAEVRRDYSGSGWAELRVDTSMAAHHSSARPSDVAEAAGFAEGAATAAEIAELRARFAGGAIRSLPEQEEVMRFARQQWPAVERTVHSAMQRIESGGDGDAGLGPALRRAGRAYWAAAAVVVSQLRGIARGYRAAHNAAAGSDEVGDDEALWATVALNYDVDAFDITDAVRGGGGFGPGDDTEDGLDEAEDGGSRFRQTGASVRAEAEYTEEAWAALSRRGRCTLAVLATGSCVEGGSGSCDVMAAHTTWSDYAEAVRIHKHVDWSGLKGRLFGRPQDHQPWWLPAERGVASWKLSMTSYPGMVSSTDDWVQTEAGLLATETTISAADPSALGRIASTAADAAPPGSPPPRQPFPAFFRSVLASWVAPSAAAWVRAFAARNSGTSNSQWLIVDYNALRAASKAGGEAPKSLLWVLEQSPRRVVAADVTPVLLSKARGLWPSSNRPLFAPVRADLGYPAEVSRSPIVRAAAAALGLPGVGAPEGADTSGEEGEAWGMLGLWELRRGEVLTDAEARDGGTPQDTGVAASQDAAEPASVSDGPGVRAAPREGGAGEGGGDTAEGSAFREAHGTADDGDDAPVDVSEPRWLPRFREAASVGAAASVDAAAGRPWLSFGRRRAGPRGLRAQGHLQPGPMRFAAASASFAHTTERVRVSREQYDSGFGGPVASGAGWYSFDANARAAQLRAAAPTAQSVLGALRLARLNAWPASPLSHGRPYFAPAARFDLADETDVARGATGGAEAKATSAALNAAMKTVGVAGPSRGAGWRHSEVGASGQAEGALLPPFDWRSWTGQGVCGDAVNPALGQAGAGSDAGVGVVQCACGPEWSRDALQLPCCLGCSEDPGSEVPRAVVLGSR